MDNTGQGILGEVRRAFARGGTDARFLTAVHCALYAAMAFTLSTARVLDDGAPFGMAFVACAGTGWSGVAALVGSAAGYLLSGGINWGIRYLAASVLTYTTAVVFHEFEFYRRQFFMPAAAGVIMALTAFLGSFSISGASTPDAAKLLLETTLAFSGAYFFRHALEKDREISESSDLRRSISVTVLLACLLSALTPVKLFGELSVGRSLALVVLMSSALKGGMLTGAAAGTVLGLAMDLSSGGSSFYAMSYAFSGLLSGVFSRRGRLVFTLSFILSGALAVACAWGESVYISSLYENFAASVIFMLLPGRAVGGLGMLLHDRSRGGGERDLRRFVSGRVRGLSEAYGELYTIIENGLESRSNDEDVARIFDRAADAVCVKCREKNRCWNAEYVDTLSALNDATQAMTVNGALSENDIPLYFRQKCESIGAFVTAVNSELRSRAYRRQLKARLAESSAVAWGQFADMSQVLSSVADELGSVNGSDALAEHRLTRYLRSLDIDAEVSVYRDGRGRLRATMESGSLAPLLGSKDYLSELSKVLGVRVCLPQGAPRASSRLTVLEAEPLAVSVGIASLKKRGERVSGDKGSYFKTDSGVLCVILSDGMGSGDEAARDSARVVAILEKFLRSGADGAAAMKVLNSALLLRGGDNWGFATADLMCIDLFTGETCFYKYGAAPSYVRTAGGVRRIKGEALAAGLSLGGGTAPDVVRMKLAPGSTALIASDGVIAECDDEWVKNILQRDFDDMKALAKSTLREAERLYGSGDDMTVVTVRVEERK